MKKKNLKITEVYGFEKHTKTELPLFLANISAGFPSPADDYIDKKLDLNEYLIKHPAATFFVRVEGESMINAGIHSGDILIVDRAVQPNNDNVVIAVLDGELTVKRIQRKRGKLFLIADNPSFSPMEITTEMDFEVWGVVMYVIHPL